MSEIKGRQLALGAGATVGATLAFGGVAQAACTCTVDSIMDPTDAGHTTLRDAITSAEANPGSTVTFASGLSGTITLASTLPTIYADTTITGPGAGQLAVSGNDSHKIFYLYNMSSPNFQVAISGLKLTHGNAAGLSNLGDGGAIFNKDSELTLTDDVLSQNSATGSFGGFGGAICSCTETGSLTIRSSTISGNSANNSGGGIYDDHAPLTIQNSTISGNTAPQHGSGMSVYNPAGASTLQDSTISGNNDGGNNGIGGGIYLDADPHGLTIRGTTIAGNSSGDGGGIDFGDYMSYGGVELQDSIVANNLAVLGPDLAGPFDAAFSLIRNTSGATVTSTTLGSNIIGKDPQLGPLANNGGPTMTRLPADTSPVIDKGRSFGLTKDQRGQTRPVDIPSIPNSTASGADGADIGAVEVQSVPAPPPPPATQPSGPTGERAAALKRCKKKKTKAKRRNCRKRAKRLPV
jgi:hypothetical protein